MIIELTEKQVDHLIDLLDSNMLNILLSARSRTSEYNILSENEKTDVILMNKFLIERLNEN